MSHLRIGTRGSALATWQAEHVRAALLEAHPGLRVELEVIRTKGDRVLDVPLARIGGKGLFTKEIEEQLLAGAIDLAIHSLKDVPVALPDGLTLAAVSAREDPADVLVSKGGLALEDLQRGGRVLSGSLRRQAELLHRRPDLVVEPIRGNVGTRLRKFDESDADAIIFARAGLARLNLLDRVAQRFEPADFPPAPGQGALAVEIRSDDARTAELCRALEDPESRTATSAERAFLEALGGGCQVPVGAYGRLSGQPQQLRLTGMVAGLDGVRLLQQTICTPAAGPQEAAEAGRRLAGMLEQDGAREILDAVLGRPAQDAEGLR